MTEIHEYPWHVGIQMKSKNKFTKPFCGGAIISPKFVITAAHCMIHPKDKIEILIAEHLTNDMNESEHFFTSPISRAIVHEGYDSSAAIIDNDIALLELEKIIPFSQFVYPACPAQSETLKDQDVFATGWGLTEYNGNASNVLLEVQLKVQEWSKCKSYFGRYLTQNMLCAYGKNKDTCQGDSGGNLKLLKYFT